MSETGLRYFFETARFGSMRAAAEKLGIAVSSVSRQIAQLELDMGVPLLEHGRRNLRLTEAGELAVGYYRAHLGHREDFERGLADLKGLRTGKIGIAIDEGVTTTNAAATLAGFMTKFPGVVLEMQSVPPHRLIEMVAEDEAHLGIGFGIGDDPRLRIRCSAAAPLYLVTPPAHPLAKRFRVKLSDLTESRLVLPHDIFEIEALLKTAERREGVTLQPSLVTNSLSLIRSMVAHGQCVTILPAFVVGSEIQSGLMASVPLADPDLSGTSVSLVCRLGRQLPRAAARLMAILEAEFANFNRGEENRRAG